MAGLVPTMTLKPVISSVMPGLVSGIHVLTASTPVPYRALKSTRLPYPGAGAMDSPARDELRMAAKKKAARARREPAFDEDDDGPE
ncbi:MAG: hypothetical protein WA759_13530, partial [Pseudolabrys sp.]